MQTEFDIKAKTWDSDPLKVKRAQTVAEGIKSRIIITPEMNALEYGCGTGLLSFELQPVLSSITLADTSDGMLAVLKDKISATGVTNMNPVKLDLLTDPQPETKFSIIYSLMTLHHIKDTQEIMNKFYSLLKGDGYLCLADLDKEDGSFHGAGSDVHNGFDREELKSMAEISGFVNTHFSDIFEVSKEIEGKKKIFPVFLMIAQKKD